MTVAETDAKTIPGDRLTTYDVGPDGAHIRLNFEDALDGPHMLSLTIELLSGLLMTIPRILQRALQARYQDRSVRIVQPLSCW
jgi:hypothetical protein